MNKQYPHARRGVRKIIMILAGLALMALPASGCMGGVSVEEYNELSSQLEGAQQQVSSLEEELEQSRQEVQTLEDELANLGLQNVKLKTDVTDLSSDYYELKGILNGFSILPESSATGRITLINNGEAQDPSWAALKEFLEDDITDQREYELDVFVCGDFAEVVHNNMEASGIRAAVVCLKFEVGDPHAMNAVRTSDRGLVYIDCTGGQDPSFSHDKVAYISMGQPYGLVDLACAQGFSYEYYMTYRQDRQDYEESLADYNSAVAEYNAELAQYSGGIPEPAYSQLMEEKERLDQWQAELDQWQEKLGTDWQPMGVVKTVETYW